MVFGDAKKVVEGMVKAVDMTHVPATQAVCLDARAASRDRPDRRKPAGPFHGATRFAMHAAIVSRTRTIAGSRCVLVRQPISTG
ncbi:Uncharacterised protein [Burkholderia cepacia]|uniref:Uncharacterized protein n=1 Tax=Burkholderia cepacia TaxID=292 RepID=A0AAE8NJF4_BURCE|nr:hypothetical protein CSX04_01553 [Burkholderia cepacia]SQA54574.1 Uncharacterised protein [Burkholderia cepacia]